MKFVSARELRNRPGVLRTLARNDDVVVTANGKPVAMLLGITQDDLEDTAHAVRQARAQLALSRMRKHAALRGTDRMSAAALNAEIRAARRRRAR
ncbi:MAG: type II toxin-antitoxin system Phd/YefM family antitoxin [Acidobacteria bacterium]|nr:type II toxin-antitoxin system Phd/YefM family antitoxin [Acidobacteriota bacterium]